jgi:hypothetical protein
MNLMYSFNKYAYNCTQIYTTTGLLLILWHINELKVKQFKMKNEKVLTQAMIVSMFCWGLGWASNKVLSGYGSATAISFYRFLITTISLLIIGFFFKRKNNVF